MALPKIVKDAMTELIIIDIIILLKLGNKFTIITEIATPPAPLNMLQISPITSEQTHETLSAFLTNFTATSAPCTPVCCSCNKGLILHAVIATPTKSNNTLVPISKKMRISASAKLACDSVNSDIKANKTERHNEVKKICTSQILFDFGFAFRPITISFSSLRPFVSNLFLSTLYYMV